MSKTAAAKAAAAAAHKATTEYLIKVNQYIDTYQDRMIDDLREMVAIKSVSGSYEHHLEIQKVVKLIDAWLKRLRATTCERFDIGSYSVDGKSIKLPTVILASFGKDPKKKTILVYGRYDVKKADPKTWDSDPWTLEQRGGELFGRGACKGKMPLLSWFHTIEAFMMQKIPLPVNLKFIIEGMSEMNCFGLEDFLYTQRITFMKNIDYVCVNESEWLNSTIPCISYGTCGICQYQLVCTGGGGGGGGGGGDGGGDGDFTPEGILDYILNNFVDNLGNILIPKLSRDVIQINPEIEQSLDRVQCDLTLIKKNLPPFMQNWSKQKILMRLWQMPQLIVGNSTKAKCLCGSGDGGGDGGGGGGGGDDGIAKKFVLKIVPVQTPVRCAEFIFDHIHNLLGQKFGDARFKITKKVSDRDGRSVECRVLQGDTEVGAVRCYTISETRAWQESSVSPHYEAMKRATGRVFMDPPSMIKESIDSPIILILDKVYIFVYCFW